MAKEPLIDEETASILCHTALLAAWQTDNEAAEQIFSALLTVYPDDDHIRICQAVVLAFQDRLEESLELLDEVIAREPGNMRAKSFRALVMATLEDDGWRELLDEVVADGSDPASAELAQCMLSDI